MCIYIYIERERERDGEREGEGERERESHGFLLGDGVRERGGGRRIAGEMMCYTGIAVLYQTMMCYTEIMCYTRPVKTNMTHHNLTTCGLICTDRCAVLSKRPRAKTSCMRSNR